MSIHLPIRSLRPLHRQCLTFPTPKRAFSTTPTLERGLSSARKTYADPIGGKAQIRQQKLKAPSAQQEEQYRNERNLPEDVGLIPGTSVEHYSPACHKLTLCRYLCARPDVHRDTFLPQRSNFVRMEVDQGTIDVLVSVRLFGHTSIVQ